MKYRVEEIDGSPALPLAAVLVNALHLIPEARILVEPPEQDPSPPEGSERWERV